MNNSIYLRRRVKIGLPAAAEPVGEPLPLRCVLTVVKNLEPLGFVFSEALLQGCTRLSLQQLASLYQQLRTDLLKSRGAHRQHQPMYAGFPEQVMELSTAELYINALVHYWSAGQYLPPTEAREREALREEVQPTVIEVGTEAEFEEIFRQLAGANTSLSEQDREDLAWFVRTYGDGIQRLLPERIPQKETVAYLASLLMEHTSDAAAFLERYCRTTTDVLRLAVALSGGDVSLARSTRFRNFYRPERRLLLGLLERQASLTEDMLRWKGRWIRLGEKLHPGEHCETYPRTAAAFDVLRNDLPFTTFNSRVERALTEHRVDVAVEQLASRPGVLARRLDHLLRLDPDQPQPVLKAFQATAPQVSTPVLLQLLQHFRSRDEAPALRVFFPKGNVAKSRAIPNELPPLPEAVSAGAAAICEAALLERFSTLPPLGRVYLDPALKEYHVPFGARSASRSFRMVGRGSRLPLPDCTVLRFFVWWTNGQERTDIDLSATLLDAEFNYVDVLSYYHLQSYGGCHSGDIVDAPDGASEFIDITIEKVLEKEVRYVVMSLTSYTQQPYCELPECFAGWMARQEPGSGEIYEPRTVRDRLDLTANTRIALPLVFDLVDRKAVWLDMALRNNPRWHNFVHANLEGIQLTVRSLVERRLPNVHDLLALHVRARGERVASPEQADCVFSVENDTPFRPEVIAAEFLG